MKTSDLTDVRLDWAVAKAGGGGKDVRMFIAGYYDYGMFQYSTNRDLWATLIEDEKINLRWLVEVWCAEKQELVNHVICTKGYAYAISPGIAVARCFVASKLGDEVDIPEELL